MPAFSGRKQELGKETFKKADWVMLEEKLNHSQSGEAGMIYGFRLLIKQTNKEKK